MLQFKSLLDAMEVLSCSAIEATTSRKKRDTVTCSTCNAKGHTKRTCPQMLSGKNKAPKTPKIRTTKIGRVIQRPTHLEDESDESDSEDEIVDIGDLKNVLEVNEVDNDLLEFKNSNDERVVIDLTQAEWEVEAGASGSGPPILNPDVNSGPTISRSQGNSVLAVWSLFFTNEVLQTFVDATNSFARNTLLLH